MFGAVAGNPTGDDLSTFRDKVSQDAGVLVINIEFLVGAESADLAP